MALSNNCTPKHLNTPKLFITNGKRVLRDTAALGNTPVKSLRSTTIKNKKCSTPKNIRISTRSAETPDCYNPVTLDLPLNNEDLQSSKEEADELRNLTVAVRIRPLNSSELSSPELTDIVRVRNQELIIRSQCSNLSGAIDHIFQYDHVFWSCDEQDPIYSTQEDIFFTMGKPLLQSAFKGYNACLFAYGQTGSGKSYSMMGKNMYEIADIDSEKYSGITPRFCRDLFRRISELESTCSATVEVSYFEIYNEKIHDLLSPHSSSTNKSSLKVREHPVWGPYVEGLTLHSVKTYEKMRDLLILGNKNRAVAYTNMNDKSSRSHSIFSIDLCLTENFDDNETIKRSRVSLVDLAGSERLGNSCSNEERIKQGVSINKSLLTLGKVISSLADQKKNNFVPYRESILTWLLRESLGGNSLTSMLATITPANTHIDETLSTLRYACQARSIINRARINENAHDLLIRELKLEVERLRALKEDCRMYNLEKSRNSNSLNGLDDTNEEELQDLKRKLTEAEKKLSEAEECWKLKFMQSKENQLKELAEIEKCKEELESKIRILKTSDDNYSLPPYETNFLQDLEGVLTDNFTICDTKSKVETIKNWCSANGFLCTLSLNTMEITDLASKKHAQVVLNDSVFQNINNMLGFVENLNWKPLNKTPKKLTKSEILCNMNKIYQALSNLQPPECDNHLSLLFARVNRSLQNFESSLMNSIKETRNVKFDV